MIEPGPWPFIAVVIGFSVYGMAWGVARAFPAVVALAAFPAASVVNMEFSGYVLGIQPAYVLVAILVGLAVIERRQSAGSSGLRRQTTNVLTPLALFAVYACISIPLSTTMFRDAVVVLSPRAGMNIDSLHELKFSMANVSQFGYLAVLVCMVFVLVPRLARDRSLSVRMVLAYEIGGFLVCSFCVLQWCAWQFGIGYPSDIILSNPVYFRGNEEELIEGVRRISGTFTEPSVLACYLLGVCFYSIERQLSHRASFATSILGAISALCLLMTTSSTAYVGTAVGALLLFLRVRKDPIARQRLFPICCAVVLIFLLVISDGSARSWIFLVADNAIFSKASTSSFSERLSADMHAAWLCIQTWTFGAGFGSTRSSSAVATLLGNVGVWGMLLLVMFAMRIAALVRCQHHGGHDGRSSDAAAIAASVVGMSVGCAVSNPDFNFLPLWINVSILIGVCLQGHQARSTRQDDCTIAPTSLIGLRIHRL